MSRLLGNTHTINNYSEWNLEYKGKESIFWQRKNASMGKAKAPCASLGPKYTPLQNSKACRKYHIINNMESGTHYPKTRKNEK